MNGDLNAVDLDVVDDVYVVGVNVGDVNVVGLMMM